MRENIVLSSKAVELSESRGYLLLVNRVCYYGRPNYNGVSLSVDTAEQYAQTLVDMPVYAKYVPNLAGEPSFGGHEAYIDEDGEVAFDTMPIGVHTSVEVRDDIVETHDGVYENLPCLFATQKIWTRNKNIVAAVKRLFTDGKLYNSWEISYDTCRYLEDGGKELIDYTFEGNCFLGVDNMNFPAYGPSAEVISLSALQKSEAAFLVASAAAKDILTKTDEELEGCENAGMENDMNEIIISTSEDAIVTLDLSEIDVVDSETDAATSENESVVVDEVSEDNSDESNAESDGVHEEEQKDDEEVSSEDESVNLDGLYSAIANLTDSLNRANEQIEQLTAELEGYRAAEHEAMVADLRQYVEDAACFSKEEIESESMQNLISSLDKASIAQMIADRVVASSKNKTEPISKKAVSSVVAVVTDAPPAQKMWRPIMDDFFRK